MVDFRDVENLFAASQPTTNGDSLESTLERVGVIATRTIRSCEMAGFTLLREGTPVAVAATDDDARVLDDQQCASGRGPALEAWRAERAIHVTGSAGAGWPEFAAEAARRGVRSTLALPLLAQDAALGAVCLYSRQGDFESDAEELGALYATEAAVAVAAAAAHLRTYELTVQLQEALRSRDLIGQAKGVLMARRGITADRAFDVLREASQQRNTKLREVADHVVLTGELPGA